MIKPKKQSENFIPSGYSQKLAGISDVSSLSFVFLLFVVLPIIASVFLSFTYYNMLQAPSFIGFNNYFNLIVTDTVFLKALKNTLLFARSLRDGKLFPLFDCGVVYKRASAVSARIDDAYILCAFFIVVCLFYMAVFIQRRLLRLNKRLFNEAWDNIRAYSMAFR